MNLIRVNDDLIINLDNVTHVDHYEVGLITLHFNFSHSNGFGEMPPAQYTIDGPDADALWDRLCAAERAGARVLA